MPRLFFSGLLFALMMASTPSERGQGFPCVTLLTEDRVSRMDYSPDGKMLVTGMSDGFARVLSLPSGKEVLKIGPPRGDIERRDLFPRWKIRRSVFV
jgi:WD40 repeat protein